MTGLRFEVPTKHRLTVAWDAYPGLGVLTTNGGPRLFDADPLGEAARVNEWLIGVDYRDGWAMQAVARVDATPWAGVALIVNVTTEDSRDVPAARAQGRQPRIVRVTHTYPMPEVRSRPELLAWVRKVLHLVEQHESDEWLRVDGELYHDPHQGA